MQYSQPYKRIIFIGVMNNLNTKTSNEIDANQLLKDIALKQDKLAFAKLFKYYAPRIKSYLAQNGTSLEEADELVQNTFITIWQKADQFNQDKSNASTWIFTIARNKKIDSFRKNKKEEVNIDDIFSLSDITQNIESNLNEKEQTTIIKNALSKLPSKQAEVIKMAYLQDKTHQNISDEKNISIGTVKSRIRLGLGKLKKYLRKGEDI